MADPGAVTGPLIDLVRVQETGAHYAVLDGRARYVATMDVVDAVFPDGTWREVPLSFVESLRLGPQVPAPVETPMCSTDMRRRICADLVGEGIEFGAGPRPAEIPASATVRYADRFSDDEFVVHSSAARSQEGAQFVPVDLVADFVWMDEIEPVSVDFIVAFHVIEHVGNPLQALESAAGRLRSGGKLVLVVPDKTRTFDVRRPVSQIDRMLLTYFVGSRERELDGYFEMARHVDGLPPEKAFTTALERWRLGVDTHIHTFSYDSFLEAAQLACEMFGYTDVWSHDGQFAEQPDNNEFYVVLTKG